MFLLLFLLSCLTVVSAGSHSLMAFATYIVGQTQFPEFSVVLMLDDVQMLYYNSTAWKVVLRSHRDSKDYDEEQRDAGAVFDDMYNSMRDRAFFLNNHLNHTDGANGVHVHQRLAGCELLINDKPGLLQTWDAFDGQNVEEFTFDSEKNYIQMKKPWMTMWNQVKHLRIKYMYEHVYHPVCMKTLRRYLEMEKKNVMRKVKPRVRLIKKTLSDSQGLQISCLATGFYPRHINLTLFRDGQPVDDDQITGGEILPNGDGTYQMRKSLVISEEELREEHKYNCTMKHLNLDNKLDIIFDVAESDPGSFTQSVVFSVLVFMCVVVLITALIIWRKRRAGQGSVSQVNYSPTPSSVQDE
ncbi:BOLA class I histocompatibility antigen, alpha chain BL3-7-like [Sinocyclocheilus anshuiensis]|uniref:BOLA class I histocompatibility antigen, alpha chain BL3-7-like n=1 Tax=Sinocyclocheilus anshuiensis TaxID=1608454 RepID=A0A671KD45_9TELE|nr:PREDICTED: BOLA class I histocompatibility antigen, alpha chain BL3-7-like [Sinocyclocheilus anshuiensis]